MALHSVSLVSSFPLIFVSIATLNPMKRIKPWLPELSVTCHAMPRHSWVMRMSPEELPNSFPVPHLHCLLLVLVSTSGFI